MTLTEQRDMALVLANEQRAAVAELKRDIRDGKVALVDLLEDPPGCVHGMGIIDVLRLGYRGSSRCRMPAHLEALGREAAAEGINLLVPVERSSLRTRRWVAVRARWFVSNGRGRCEMKIEAA